MSVAVVLSTQDNVLSTQARLTLSAPQHLV